MTVLDQQPKTPGQRAHAAAVKLLDQTVAELHQAGWVRHTVSHLRHPGTGARIRHHYSGGVWELRFTCDGGPDGGHSPDSPTVRYTRWDVRKTLPTVEAVISGLRGDSRCWPTTN